MGDPQAWDWRSENFRVHTCMIICCLGDGYLNYRDVPMLLVHASHMCVEIKSFFVVAVSNTCLHNLRDLQNLQQLSVL